MGKQQVGNLCLSPEIRGRDVAKIKHQTMSLLLHVMIFTFCILFRLRCWKPSTDGLEARKD